MIPLFTPLCSGAVGFLSFQPFNNLVHVVVDVIWMYRWLWRLKLLGCFPKVLTLWQTPEATLRSSMQFRKLLQYRFYSSFLILGLLLWHILLWMRKFLVNRPKRSAVISQKRKKILHISEGLKPSLQMPLCLIVSFLWSYAFTDSDYRRRFQSRQFFLNGDCCFLHPSDCRSF